MRKRFLVFGFLLIPFLMTKGQYQPVENFNVRLEDYDKAVITWQPPTMANQIVLFEGFESGIISNGWITIDSDGDGENWEIHPSSWSSAHSGQYSVASYSWFNGNTLYPNNWLISPAVTIPAGAKLDYWVAAISATYSHEHYQVRLSTTGAAISDFSVLLLEETLPQNNNAWQNRTIDLSSFAGQTVRIAFVHTNISDVFALKIDDITVGTFAKFNPTIDGFTLFRQLPNQSTFTALTTLPASAISFTETLSVEGETAYRIVVNYSDGNSSNPSTIKKVTFYDWYPPVTNAAAYTTENTLWVSVVSNYQTPVVKTLISESFENSNLSSWNIIDADGDGQNWEIHTATPAYHGTKSMASYSWFNGVVLTPNNWAISKKLPLGAKWARLSWYVATLSQTYPAETYSVMWGQNLQNTNSFSPIFSETLSAQNASWQRREISLPELPDTAYLAFRHHNSTNQFALKIDSITFRTYNTIVGYRIYVAQNPLSNYEFIAEIDPNSTGPNLFVPITMNSQLDTLWIKVAALYANEGESVKNQIIKAEPYVSVSQLPENFFKIFPNPTTGFLKISTTNQLPLNGTFIIRNLNGTEIVKIPLSEISQEIKIDNISAGIYFAELITAHGRVVEKLVVQP